MSLRVPNANLQKPSKTHVSDAMKAQAQRTSSPFKGERGSALLRPRLFSRCGLRLGNRVHDVVFRDFCSAQFRNFAPVAQHDDALAVAHDFFEVG